ncbi:hypothetical protein HMPREF9244_00173 [Alloscardovia omnicolens F0580]|uniref:Uncharacterized protein n=1 Tax=Alloscardovia omnicolens F0580 TaxID=1321816 RepID=U1RCG8_9BIFI|nr:hypothetical protein HMPREF9244_00173 [Alloscardovia omnicolens F0580]
MDEGASERNCNAAGNTHKREGCEVKQKSSCERRFITQLHTVEKSIVLHTQFVPTSIQFTHVCID